MADRGRAWADEIYSSTVVPGTPFKRDLLANAPTMDTLTVVRLIGYLDIGIAITSEIEFSQRIDVGIGVASVEAFSVGGTSLPSPKIEAQAPPRGWLYAATKLCWQFKGGTEGQQRFNAIFEFDLGAMRKVDKGTLFIRIDNTDEAGTSSTVSIIGRTRALCLL